MTTRSVSPWPVALLALPAAVSIWAGWVGLGGLTGFGRVQLLPGIVDRLVLNTAITLPVGMEAYAAYALRAWLTPTAPRRAREFAKTSALTALTLGCLGQIAYHLMAAAHWTAAPWPITATVSCLPVGVLGMGAALAHLLSNHDPDELAQPQPSSGIAADPPATAVGQHRPYSTAPQPFTSDQPVGTPSRAPFPVIPNLTTQQHPHPAGADRPAGAPSPRPEPMSPSQPAPAPAGRPVERPGDHPATGSTGRPAEQPANRPDPPARPGPTARTAPVRRRGRRKGRPKTDAQLAAAVRELAARNGGVPPSQYQVRHVLGVGGGRAARLVAAYQPTTTAPPGSNGTATSKEASP